MDTKAPNHDRPRLVAQFLVRPAVAGAMLQLLVGAAITAGIATLTSYLYGQERQAVGVLLLLFLGVLLAIAVLLAFYGDPTWPPLRRAALLTSAVLVCLMFWVAWEVIHVRDVPPRTYTGTTSQGRTVEFDVVEGGNAIDRIKFDVECTCPVGTSDPVTQTEPCTRHVNKEVSMTRAWPIAYNTFCYAPGDYDFGAVFEHSKKTASGFLRVHTSATPGVEAPCESDLVTWTATAR